MICVVVRIGRMRILMMRKMAINRRVRPTMMKRKDNCGTTSCKKKRLRLAIFCSEVVKEEASKQKTAKLLRFEK